MPSANLPAFTDGPERFIGGPRCPEHHLGQRENIPDGCCCCDPCNYQRFKDFSNRAVAPRPITNACCRCVPQAICMTFTPAVGADPCCRTLSQVAFPVYADTNDDTTITYSFTFGDTTLSWTIEYHYAYDPADAYCTWHFLWEARSIDDHYVIDHVNINCLDAPDMDLSGVTDLDGCSGVLSFTSYHGDKVPFVNRNIEDIDREVFVPNPTCNCENVVRVLCVAGVRHAGGEFETVEFGWRDDLGPEADRWEYLPPCGDPSTKREVIYLRGDYEGNCWLELDFEQADIYTNDWADPPNTYDYTDPTGIRDGMIPIPTCGSCGFLVKSDASGGRWVNITSGHCGRWEYACGKCRCVPRTLCVFGVIDDEIINTVATWNPDVRHWIANSGTLDEIHLGITRGPPCPPPREDELDDECVGTANFVENDFLVPLENSVVAAQCGMFLGFELYSNHNEYFPDIFNWLWASSGFCGCLKMPCGICLNERCGGPIETLYATMMARQPAQVEPPQPAGPDCNVTITLQRWERFVIAGQPPTPTLQCGYLGFYTYTCDGNTYRIRFEITFGHNIIVTKELLSGTWDNVSLDTANFALWNGVVVDPISCDPLYFEIDWQGASAEVNNKNCPWGCVDGTPQGLMEIRLEIAE